MNRAYNDDDHQVGLQAAGGNPEWPLSLPHTTTTTTYSTTSMATTCHHHDQEQHLPHHDHYSWSQLLLGGLMGEDDEDKVMTMINNHVFQESLENSSTDLVRQEEPYHSSHDVHAHHQDFRVASDWLIMPTSFMSSSNMLDFSSKNPPPDHHQSSSECMSSSTGGVAKKARVQPSSSPTPSSFMVTRKEKLGDRIAALHQLVSPFGKTDTASVLLESIGYIRFLHTQIQALTLPYLDSKSGQQCVQGEMNCIFPQDPGQLLNENCIKKRSEEATNQIPNEEAKKDLRSRGLCLVPVSCTPQVGSNNIGSDYWAPAAGSGCF